jgi:4-diphosphocytidyl-2-C-methyl-D-erythritol kinase
VINDFEKPAGERYPAITAIIEQLYAQGAVYASMSGSGSTVYGLFAANAKPRFAFPGEYLVREIGFRI